MSIVLNDEQKAIVEYEDDKFLSVQAGPGSGKTRVLVEKVKHMVNTLNVEPETFLIITFQISLFVKLYKYILPSLNHFL